MKKKIIDISILAIHDLAARSCFLEIYLEREREIDDDFNIRVYDDVSLSTLKRAQRAQIELMKRGEVFPK